MIKPTFWKDFSGCFTELRLWRRNKWEKSKTGRPVRSLLQVVEAKVVGVAVMWGHQIWVTFESCQWVWGVTEERGEGLGIMQNTKVWISSNWNGKDRKGQIAREEVEFSFKCVYSEMRCLVNCQAEMQIRQFDMWVWISGKRPITEM